MRVFLRLGAAFAAAAAVLLTFRDSLVRYAQQAAPPARPVTVEVYYNTKECDPSVAAYAFPDHSRLVPLAVGRPRPAARPVRLHRPQHR